MLGFPDKHKKNAKIDSMIKLPDTPSRLPQQLKQKIAGLMIPLFSIRTEHSLGAGEILDLIPCMDYMKTHHLSVLQMLPIYETAPDETSPYQALSSFAIDPAYLSVLGTTRFQNNDAVRAYLASEDIQTHLKALEEKKTADLKTLRALKYQLLHLVFKTFKSEEWDKETAQARMLQDFIQEKSEWLEDYALFWQIKENQSWMPWCDWPERLKNRDKECLQQFQVDHAEGILFIQYVQWVLWSQWAEVRQHAKTHNMKIMGDLPFLLSQDSAEIWRAPHLFHADLSVGAPPDDFSETGQDWGLPCFNWEEMEKENFNWWRLRIREAAHCYDLIRLDHVVGFFRVWVMPKTGDPYFEPWAEDAQIVRGKTLLSAIIEEAGQCIPIAEDLGCIPDFVRNTLNEMQIAGLKIMRWEKQGEVYIHPRDYAPLSLSTTGTHDTSTLLGWWQEMSLELRRNFLGLLDVLDVHSPESDFSEILQHRVLDLLLGSPSQLVILPIQDILLEEDRINIPGTVGPHNWGYRMPILLSALDQDPRYCKKFSYLSQAILRSERSE